MSTEWDSDDWCFVYLRMSNKKDAGIERQRPKCLKLAAALNLRVRPAVDPKDPENPNDYHGDGSATIGIRAEFEEILVIAAERRARLGPKTLTHIVCWHSDRFARKPEDLIRCEKAGIVMHGVESGFYDLSSPSGYAVAMTVTTWSEYEGKQKAARQRLAHEQRASEGRSFWAVRPFGFNPDGTLNTCEANALREVYQNVLHGASLTSCALLLNDKGLLTTKDNRWRTTTVRNVLIQTRNCGILTYQGKEVGPGNWDAIVDEPTYRAVKRIVTEPSRLTAPHSVRNGQGGRNSIMPGFATCGVCGNFVMTSNAGPRKLYRCRSGHGSAWADIVDQRAIALIAQRFNRPDAIARLAESEAIDVVALRAELEDLRRKADQYTDALDNDEMTMRQFTKLNRRNRERIADAERQLTEVGLAGPLRGLLDVDDVYEAIVAKTVAEQHMLVSLFFEKIVIQPRGQGAGRRHAAYVDYWIRGEALPIEARFDQAGKQLDPVPL